MEQEEKATVRDERQLSEDSGPIQIGVDEIPLPIISPKNMRPRLWDQDSSIQQEYEKMHKDQMIKNEYEKAH